MYKASFEGASKLQCTLYNENESLCAKEIMLQRIQRSAPERFDLFFYYNCRCKAGIYISVFASSEISMQNCEHQTLHTKHCLHPLESILNQRVQFQFWFLLHCFFIYVKYSFKFSQASSSQAIKCIYRYLPRQSVSVDKSMY